MVLSSANKMVLEDSAAARILESVVETPVIVK